MFTSETQNANKLISSIISKKCPKNDPEIGLLPAAINITKRFRKLDNTTPYLVYLKKTISKSLKYIYL